MENSGWFTPQGGVICRIVIQYGLGQVFVPLSPVVPEAILRFVLRLA